MVQAGRHFSALKTLWSFSAIAVERQQNAESSADAADSGRGSSALSYTSSFWLYPACA